MFTQHGQQLFEPVDVFLRQELCSLDASPEAQLLCCLMPVLNTTGTLLLDSSPQDNNFSSV